MTTIRECLTQAKNRLAPVSSSVSLDAQMLLAEVLGVSRAYVLAHGEDVLTPQQVDAYHHTIARREHGEPIAYILGRKPFYDREFSVSPAVLIPRPETEGLLEWALDIAQHSQPRVIVDVGTGSGALAVTFAALYQPPHPAEVYAIDISPAALETARANAVREGVNVRFLEGDLLQPLIDVGMRADLVLANLPYIASAEVPTLEVSRYEPVLALDGGADGLTLIRRLLAQARQACAPGAALLLEIGADQGAAVTQLGHDLGFAEVELRQDYAHLDRMVRLRLR
jgi:release factor glutamine methyltransferase